MTRVSFIQGTNLGNLEKEVNEFIKDKASWDIVYNTNPISGRGIGFDILHTAMIRWEDEQTPDMVECDHLNKNSLWVSHEAFERIKNSPDGVVFHTRGEAPILVSWYPAKEDD